MIWTIIFSGYASEYYPIQIGIVGFELNSFLETYIGNTGIIIILSFILLSSIALIWSITPNSFLSLVSKIKISKNDKTELVDELNDNLNVETEMELPSSIHGENEVKTDSNGSKTDSDEISIEVEEINFEEKSNEKISFDKVGLKKFDPTLDLSNFKNPGIDLLKDYGDDTIKIDQDELELSLIHI